MVDSNPELRASPGELTSDCVYRGRQTPPLTVPSVAPLSTIADKSTNLADPRGFFSAWKTFLNEANRTHFLGKRSQLRTRWQCSTKRRSGFLFSYLRVAEQPIPKNGGLTKRTQLRRPPARAGLTVPA